MKRLKGIIKKVIMVFVFLKVLAICNSINSPERYKTNCETFLGYENTPEGRSILVFADTLKDKYRQPIPGKTYGNTEELHLEAGNDYVIRIAEGLFSNEAIMAWHCRKD